MLGQQAGACFAELWRRVSSAQRACARQIKGRPLARLLLAWKVMWQGVLSTQVNRSPWALQYAPAAQHFGEKMSQKIPSFCSSQSPRMPSKQTMTSCACLWQQWCAAHNIDLWCWHMLGAV